MSGSGRGGGFRVLDGCWGFGCGVQWCIRDGKQCLQPGECIHEHNGWGIVLWLEGMVLGLTVMGSKQCTCIACAFRGNVGGGWIGRVVDCSCN